VPSALPQAERLAAVSISVSRMHARASRALRWGSQLRVHSLIHRLPWRAAQPPPVHLFCTLASTWVKRFIGSPRRARYNSTTREWHHQCADDMPFSMPCSCAGTGRRYFTRASGRASQGSSQRAEQSCTRVHPVLRCDKAHAFAPAFAPATISVGCPDLGD